MGPALAVLGLCVSGVFSLVHAQSPATGGSSSTTGSRPAILQTERSSFAATRRKFGDKHESTLLAAFASGQKLAIAGYPSEAKWFLTYFLERIQSAKLTPHEEARALYTAAIVWERTSDLSQARRLARQAFDLYRLAGLLNEAEAFDCGLLIANLELEFGDVGAARHTLTLLDNAGRLTSPSAERSRLSVLIEIYLAEHNPQGAGETLPEWTKAALQVRDPFVDPKSRMLHARILMRQGRWSEAEGLLNAARAEVGSRDETLAASIDYTMGYLLTMRGQYIEAEPRLRSALSLFTQRFGSAHPLVGRASLTVALAYQELGYLGEAQKYYDLAIKNLEAAYGSGALQPTRARAEFTKLLLMTGQVTVAEKNARDAIRDHLALPSPDRRSLADARFQLAFALQRLGRNPEAVQAIDAGIADMKFARGEETTDIGLPVTVKSEVMLSMGKANDALAQADEALRRMSMDNYAVPSLLSRASVARARALLALERSDTALQMMRQASDVAAARLELAAGLTTLGEAEQRSVRPYYAAHVELAAEIWAKRPSSELLQESFRAGQRAMISTAARSVTQLAARFSNEATSLGQIIRRRQDLVREWRALDKLKLEIETAEKVEDKSKSLQTIGRRLEEHAQEVEDIDRRLNREFPEFAQLAFPRPTELAELQSVLTGSEALIQILATDQATYVWVISDTSADLHVSSLRRDEVSELVRRIRRTIVFREQRPFLPPFDTESSWKLYEALLAPLDKTLKGKKTLHFVLDGPLQSLSPALFVTREPARGQKDYASLSWLGREHPVSILPSASSLLLLRKNVRRSNATEPMMGFGAPDFGSSPGRQRKLRNVDVLLRKPRIDRSAFASISALPESKDELLKIAATLKANRASLFFGADATVGRLLASRTDNYRVVAFATHAGVAGEFAGLTEPAIILAPGVETDPQDDGVLTASEVAELKLDAEWVILSACNTAADDGTPSAEGLSGLAQAFMYAGARSLLVSHWAVDTMATVEITSGTFEYLATDRTLSKAEALQKAILRLATGELGTEFTHPAYWAPFVIVGDGASRQP